MRNPGADPRRPTTMRTTRLRTLAAFLLAGSLLAAGCGDDEPDETRSDDSSTTAPPGAGADDGTTTVPDGGSGPGGSLPDRPAELVGEVTEAEGGRFLVEEDPTSPDSGRKAWVAIEGPVFRGEEPAAESDIQVGQQVTAWTGICAESYPEQCGAEALVIEDG